MNLRNFLALSSFGFSIVDFCFSLHFDATDMFFQISGQRESGLDVECAAARALAWSLLGLRGGPGANGDIPETHDVIRECGHSLGVPN